MKRHLNTSYRLVWNHITGTLVVASELARSRGKRTGVAVALSLAAVTSVPVLAADTVVQAGETVSGGTLTNHDNQIVFGTANGMTISTGLEYGPDNEANTGGQWIQNGGIANNTVSAASDCERMAMTLSGYNGGLGWVQRDRRLASQKGLDSTRWFGHVATVNAGRNAASWRENRHYPQRILRELAPRYLTWGGSSCVASG